MTMSKPRAVPRYNQRTRLLRAALGFLCLASLVGACVSLLVLVIWENPLAGFFFGLSGLLFWSVIKLGKGLTPREPHGEWGTAVPNPPD